MSRTCVACAHPELVAIEAALASGASVLSTAKAHGLSEAALRRHVASHAPRMPQDASTPAPAQKGDGKAPKLPRFRSRSQAEAFAASPKAPEGFRSLEAILVALETEAKTARSDSARLKALDMLTNLLPPPPPTDDSKEPTPADARRLAAELFGDKFTLDRGGDVDGR